MFRLTKLRRSIGLTLITVFLLGIVGVNAFLTLSDSSATMRDRILALSQTPLVLLLTIVEVYPVLRELLQPKEELSDEELENAFTELEGASAALKQGRYEEAKDRATKVIRILPKKAEAYRVRAEAYSEIGKVASALEDYDKAIDLEPGYPYAYAKRASLLQKMGEYRTAIPDMEKTVALAPELPGQMFQLATVYFDLGHFKEAVSWFQEVLDHPDTTSHEKEMSREYLDRFENLQKRQKVLEEFESRSEEQ
jgi:tetratricopeptide (TPR) repeat protein